MKKILFTFLFLITFFNSSLFAGQTCHGSFLFKKTLQGSNCGSNKVSQNWGTWVNHPTTWSCVFLKHGSSTYISSGSCPNSIEPGKMNEEIAKEVPEGSKCVLINGSIDCGSIPDNGFLDDDLNPGCNSGHTLTGVGIGDPFCMPTPPNGDYDDELNLTCNSGFVKEGNNCVPSSSGGDDNNDEGQNPDGSCQSGYFPTLDGGCFKGTTGGGDGGTTGGGDGGTTGGGDGGTTGGGTTGGGSTGGGDGGTTGGGDGGTTGGGTTGGGTTGGGTTGGGSTGGGDGGTTGGGDGGTTGGDGGTDGENSDNGTSTSYICPDGGRSYSSSSNPNSVQHCDRTCEQVGLKTNNSNMCYSDKTCPPGEDNTGFNGFTGDPICYKPSNNEDLQKSDTLLAKIVENTSLNKNSNFQLAVLNNNTVKTNAKLEAVKGGLSVINTSISTGNEQLTQINSKLSDSEGNNLIQDISTSLKSIVSPMSAESETSNEAQLTQKLNDSLDSTFTKYNNVLGFGSSYAQAPPNITVLLMGKQYTLIDFSLLDDHVDIIRALFLSLAYLYGFIFFLRGGK